MKPDKHTIVGLGGTFDHFHKGHEAFLLYAAPLAELLFIGVTDNSLTMHKPFASTIEPYALRAQIVETFCKQHGISAQIFKLNDVFGPTTTKDSKVEAIVVTTETQGGGALINTKRTTNGLEALPVYVCDMVRDDSGRPITSTAIRAGQVNRDGTVYMRAIENGLELTDTQRAFFSTVRGRIVTQPTAVSESTYVAVVGDVILDTCINENWHYDLGIYDKRTNRTATVAGKYAEPKPDYVASSNAGTMSKALIDILKSWQPGAFKHLLVQGEEDLAAVALVLLLPLGSMIYYGQPNQGIVEMEVTVALKEQVHMVLNPKSFPKPENLLQ